jgi:hypothetical protein
MLRIEWQVGGARLQDAQHRHRQVSRVWDSEGDDTSRTGAIGREGAGQILRLLVKLTIRH